MKERESERKSFDFFGLFIFKVPYAQNQQNYFSFESLEKLLGMLALFLTCQDIHSDYRHALSPSQLEYRE